MSVLLLLYVQSIPEAVAMWRLQIKRLRVRFPHWNFFFFFSLLFFSVSFFSLSFSFMLAPPFQCSSIFLVLNNHIGPCQPLQKKICFLHLYGSLFLTARYNYYIAYSCRTLMWICVLVLVDIYNFYQHLKAELSHEGLAKARLFR